ncbi:MAG: hypothetical protein A3J40_13500 [Erythrobacter sp. RIFCSPHIGHO2_12_FULL_63_10]|nr:MAG: hypothetical protein A3J40_13500 [Erythrobacter sp. RIFCSPHIGHO2_12_FULL_63_10]
MTTRTKPSPASANPAARPSSKIDQVIALLEREQGATLAEITGITSWQPHSARAVLTGLRKKGHTIVKSKRDDVTCYLITNSN